MPKDKPQTATSALNDLIRNKNAQVLAKSLSKALAKYNKNINAIDIDQQYKDIMQSAKKISIIIKEYERKPKLTKKEDKSYQQLKSLWDQAYQINQLHHLKDQQQSVANIESMDLPTDVIRCEQRIDLLSDYIRNRREAATRIHYGYAELLSDLNDKNQSFITNTRVTDHLNSLLSQYKDTLDKLKAQDEVVALSAKMKSIVDATNRRYDIPAYAAFRTIVQERKAGLANTIQLIDPVIQGKKPLYQFSAPDINNQFKKVLQNENEFFKLMDSVNQSLKALDMILDKINKDMNDKSKNAIFSDVLKRKKVQIENSQRDIVAAMNDFNNNPDAIVNELQKFAKSAPVLLVDFKKMDDRVKNVSSATAQTTNQTIKDIDGQLTALDTLLSNRSVLDRYGIFLTAQKRLLTSLKSDIVAAVRDNNLTNANLHSKNAVKVMREIKESLIDIYEVQRIFDKSLVFSKQFINRCFDDGAVKDKALRAVSMLQRQKIANLRDLNSLKNRYITEIDLFPKLLAKQVFEKINELQNAISELSKQFSPTSDSDRLINLSMLAEYIDRYYDPVKSDLREDVKVAFSLARDPSVELIYQKLKQELAEAYRKLPKQGVVIQTVLQEKSKGEKSQNEIFALTLQEINNIKGLEFVKESSAAVSEAAFFKDAGKENNKPKPLPPTPKKH